jgi:hypothetical protein
VQLFVLVRLELASKKAMSSSNDYDKFTLQKEQDQQQTGLRRTLGMVP